jgi:glycine dehydrogenase
MIEPTESESKEELDRFAEAMIAIKQECEAIKNGQADPADNPLKMSPHNAREVCGDNWTHPYTRTQAAFPLPGIAENKCWSFVARVDNGFGDRNLVCIVQ